MDHQQAIAIWSAQGELHRQRRLGVTAVEVFHEAQESARINGGLRLAETSLDGLQALHGLAAAKVKNTPTLDYFAQRILSTVEMACCERIARYMLR